MTVAWNNLCRYRFRFQSQARTHKSLNFGFDIRKRANRSRNLPESDLFACLREASAIALHFGVPVCSLETKGDRFRMHPVGSTNHWRVLMRFRQPFEHD